MKIFCAFKLFVVLATLGSTLNWVVVEGGGRERQLQRRKLVPLTEMTSLLKINERILTQDQYYYEDGESVGEDTIADDDGAITDADPDNDHDDLDDLNEYSHPIPIPFEDEDDVVPKASKEIATETEPEGTAVSNASTIVAGTGKVGGKKRHAASNEDLQYFINILSVFMYSVIGILCFVIIALYMLFSGYGVNSTDRELTTNDLSAPRAAIRRRKCCKKIHAVPPTVNGVPVIRKKQESGIFSV